MTLKTITGPSTQDALADARRLFGADVVLLQSSPGGLGVPASVTVAYDDLPSPTAPPRRAAPAIPDTARQATPRPYGYPTTRQTRPPVAEHFSVSLPTAQVWTPPAYPAVTEPDAVVEPVASREPVQIPVADPLDWEPAVPALVTVPTPSDESDVAELKQRLASLEAELAEVRAAVPPPLPSRAPLVLVGREGSGKTTLAIRLTQSPQTIGATQPAVLVVAPADGLFLDPTPSFWSAGVPAFVVQTADDVVDALRTVSGADLLVVDTPALSGEPDLARRAVARLGAILAPLAAVDVALVVDASRPTHTWSPQSLSTIGLAPDALALTRLDEATCAPGTWEARLGVPAWFASAGPASRDLTASMATGEGPGMVPASPPSVAPALPPWLPLPFDPVALAPTPSVLPRDERTLHRHVSAPSAPILEAPGVPTFP